MKGVIFRAARILSPESVASSGLGMRAAQRSHQVIRSETHFKDPIYSVDRIHYRNLRGYQAAFLFAEIQDIA